jgi:hypothetical protein
VAHRSPDACHERRPVRQVNADLRVIHGIGRCLASAMLLIASACASAPRGDPGVNAVRGVRLATALDPDLLDISLAAAGDLRGPGSEEVLFRGVFVDGIDARSVSDSVIRAYGFRRPERITDASEAFTVPTTGAPSGPVGATRMIVSFTTVRVARDSAYVGVDQMSTRAAPRTTRATCVTLVRVQAKWVTVRRGSIIRTEDCGK